MAFDALSISYENQLLNALNCYICALEAGIIHFEDLAIF